MIEGISDKQRAFVDRYLIHLNASKAAREVGISPATAKVWLNAPRWQLVQDLVVEGLKNRSALNRRAEVTLRAYLTSAISATPADFFDEKGEPKPLDQVDPEALLALQSYSFKSWDRAGVGKSVQINLGNKAPLAQLLAKICGASVSVDNQADEATDIMAAKPRVMSKLDELAAKRRQKPTGT